MPDEFQMISVSLQETCIVQHRWYSKTHDLPSVALCVGVWVNRVPGGGVGVGMGGAVRGVCVDFGVSCYG